MLTICGLPKPFQGHFDIIQRNAIRSWTGLVPRCDIILLGSDEGTAGVAAELGIRHLPDIARNECGTPLLDSAFGEVERAAHQPMICYVNSDIILMSDFLSAVREVVARFPRFLLIGRRWDLDLNVPLVLEDGWEAKLRSLVETRGRLHRHAAIDYFVFPKGLWSHIPPFAVGRTIWDGWLVCQATRDGVPVVDLTERAMVVHQNHPYVSPQGLLGVERGPEGQRNLALAGGYSHCYTIWDAKYKLTRRGIKKRRSFYFIYRRLVTAAERHPSMSPILRMVRAIVSALRGQRLDRMFGDLFRPDT